jgi:HD-GYP domain-containing protein (c-di-GMP phosphodiesterase class II)
VLPTGLITSTAPALSGASAEDLLAHVQALVAERAVLDRELLRCHQQLELVFAVTAHVARLREPGEVQSALLQHYAHMLKADVLYLDHGGCCRQVTLEPAADAPPPVSPVALREALAYHIELVRRRGGARLPPLTHAERAVLGEAHVLLGALPAADGEPTVVVALRPGAAPAFDEGDVVASDAVLAYGAHVLGSSTTVRDLQRTAVETVCTLVNAIDAKDNYTSAHSERVGDLARLVGEALNLPRVHVQNIEWAGLLHDVGKIGVPEHILNKPGVLTPEEFEAMKRHAQIGYEVLRPVAQLEPVLAAVLCHHENHDGSGYPEGLRGDEIPIDAQIIHIVDIFDALTTTRPYRPGYSLEEAFVLLEAGAGTMTEPRLTRLFIETMQRAMAADPVGFRARFGYVSRDAPVPVPPGRGAGGKC